MDSENRLCLLFVGLSELRRRLQVSVHESLDQRIVMRYQLDCLTHEELPDYLQHRLRRASCELPLFEPEAIEAIFQGSGALPRKVNSLAHFALIASAINKQQTVTADHVQSALGEIGL
jgi:type II secretory pathway predicted ATPase ExeA